MPTTKDGNYSAAVAGQNVSESEAKAMTEIAGRQAVENYLRRIFMLRLRSPLGQIERQVNRIERLVRKVSR